MLNLPEHIVALVTPMDFEQQIDFIGLHRLLDMHTQQDTKGILLFGSTGEGLLLSDQERFSVLDYIFNAYQWHGSVWVSCTHHHPKGVQHLIGQAAAFGVEGVMVSTPMYIKPSQSALIQYFSHIADYSPLPLMLYNVPARTGCSMDVNTVLVLSHHEKIIAIKDADISIKKMKSYHDIKAGFAVYSGDDSFILPALSHGAYGAVTVIGNLLPGLVNQMIEGYHETSYDLAQLIEQGIAPLTSLMTQLHNPAAIKWMLSERNIITSMLRAPLAPLTVDEQMQLQPVLMNAEEMLQVD